MSYLRRHWPGLLVALVACTFSIAAVTFAQAPGGQQRQVPRTVAPFGGPSSTEIVKHPPIAALRPDQIRKLPAGQRAGDLPLPARHGQLHVLPSGSVPSPPQGTDPAKGKPNVVPLRFSSVDALPAVARTLLLLPRFVPSGWELAGTGGQMAEWPDGSQQVLWLELSYERRGHFRIRIYRAPVGERVIGIVNSGPDTRHALTLSHIADVPVAITHQLPGAQIQPVMTVEYVHRGVYTRVEVTALDLDDLMRVATALISAEKL